MTEMTPSTTKAMMTSNKADSASTRSSAPYTVHTFPPSPHCYNISPFGVKLESFLRINKIDYDVVHTTKFSKKGTIPYITVNETGEQLCDSNRIISMLEEESEHHKMKTISSSVTPQQRAISHAMIRMLEEHTAQIGFYYRYGLNMSTFFESLNLGERMFHSDTSMKGRQMGKLWQRLQPMATLKKTKARGLARHDLEVLWNMSFDDLDALEVLLSSDGGEQGDYFFGRSTPSTLDCAVFGHLVQFQYIPIDFPQTEHLQSKCPHLVAFIKRFQAQYWPDWEEKCERKPNAKYSSTDEDETTKSRSVSRTFLLASAAVAVLASLVFGYHKRALGL